MRGTLCLAFPDAYSIGMSHHGLQVLYDLMNRRDDWACERAFTPLGDMEKMLREHEACRSRASKRSRRSTSSTCSASRCNTTSATATS